MSEKRLLVLERQNHILTLLMWERQMIAASASKKEGTNRQSLVQVGNIYIGKVQNIVKNIDAAFVEVEKGHLCHLSLTEAGTPLLTNGRVFDGKLKIGDELLVQVSREAVKTKQPSVTTKISLSGHYLAIASGTPSLGVSNKLSKGSKQYLTGALLESGYIDKEKKCRQIPAEENFPQPISYGMILRTNAGNLQENISPLLEEWQRLEEEYKKLIRTAVYRPCFTCLKKVPPLYLNRLKDFYREEYEEIVTESPELYQEITEYLKETMPAENIPVRLYEDESYPLWKLYNVEHRLEEALGRKVWLKSGGYLVIEPTEALTVIDVNTGKYESKRGSFQETCRKINLEAASEILRQIRLRNLSGIIIVDFINMDSDDFKDELMSSLKQLAKKDPVRLTIVGMTALGLVEITRKKINKPLKEQLSE